MNEWPIGILTAASGALTGWLTKRAVRNTQDISGPDTVGRDVFLAAAAAAATCLLAMVWTHE